jgi:formylglycine-generating enzyme required for sulfatase activity
MAITLRSRAIRGVPWALPLFMSCDAVLGLDTPTLRNECEESSCAGAGMAGQFASGGASGNGGTTGGSEGGQGLAPGNGGESGTGTGGGGGDDDGGECDPDALRCDAYQPERCVEGEWRDDGAECTAYCQDGVCKEAPSCAPAARTPTCVDGTSCCDTIWIPGGAYEMGRGDDESPDLTYTRRVSGFYLDRFEVTVSRFSEFLSNYSLPSEGRGQHPRIPDSGWQKSWESLPNADFPGELVVPPTSQDLETQIGDAEHCPSGGTFSATEPTLPINCVNWYVAFAFCIFDGGRLPTEAEWNYAAASGSEQRPYPWSQSVSDVSVDMSRASYYAGTGPLLALPTPVGAHPAGQGGFHRNMGQGHEDLAGNVFEWVADQWTPAPEDDCATDCMTAWSEGQGERVARGGSFQNTWAFLRTGKRASAPALTLSARYGFRCARDSIAE